MAEMNSTGQNCVYPCWLTSYVMFLIDIDGHLITSLYYIIMDKHQCLLNILGQNLETFLCIELFMVF